MACPAGCRYCRECHCAPTDISNVAHSRRAPAGWQYDCRLSIADQVVGRRGASVRSTVEVTRNTRRDLAYEFQAWTSADGPTGGHYPQVRTVADRQSDSGSQPRQGMSKVPLPQTAERTDPAIRDSATALLLAPYSGQPIPISSLYRCADEHSRALCSVADGRQGDDGIQLTQWPATGGAQSALDR